MEEYLTEVFAGLIALLLGVLIMYIRSWTKNVEVWHVELRKDQVAQWKQININREKIGELRGPSHGGGD